MRDRSSSSLTIWTRWPVSTSILSIRSRIRGGTASPAASASRVRVSARRLTVVSGVRSSCDRLSMNSVRICWRRRSSETSSRTSHRLPDGARRARTTSRGPSAPAGPNSPVAEPDPRPARAVASTWVSRKTSMTVRPTRVRGSRPRSVPAARFAATMRRPLVHLEDALRERLDERVAVTLADGRIGVEPVGALAQGAHGRDRIIRWVRRERGDGREGPATVDAEDRGRAADEQRHDRDQPGIHDASIAQPLPSVPASGGPGGGPAWQAGRPG